MRIVFAGGGTGGHIFPAIAIADEIKKMISDSQILFIGAKGKLEEKLVPLNNYTLKTLDIYGFDKSKIAKNVFLPFKFAKAVRQSKELIRDFSTDVVIGTGGFASAAPVYAALKLKIPVVIHEGNVFPGKVTRYFASKVTRVIVSFEETSQYLKSKDNVSYFSYPVRSSLKKYRKPEAKNKFGFNEKQKIILVFGGSQGSKVLNEQILKILPELVDRKIGIIWQTGVNDYKQVEEAIKNFGEYVLLNEFITDMGAAYSASDIAICRAGISSIMELAYLGVPAILVPYPFSANNHQVKNAENLALQGACIHLPQNEIGKLKNIILDLIENDEKRHKLGENINKLSDVDAASKISRFIINLIQKNGNTTGLQV
ncbi:MAG: undecaprenyldiphospho-muramoylpentapeptide beta-N-acetylglucosaminyltransferase [Ignavibacteria bacterium]